MAGSHGHMWDPVAYAAHASFVPALGGAVLELLAPKAGTYRLAAPYQLPRGTPCPEELR